ncbi:MAG: DUF5050 domain-containing protein [Oscillospiraceae bacterium]|nr:DUF5050 domain-containing protein [Oscillospiraceae bacterium]
MKKIILLTAILLLSGCAAKDEVSLQETQPAFYDTASSVIEESQPAISDTASSETDDISEQTRWVDTYNAQQAEIARQKELSAEVQFTGIDTEEAVSYGNLLQNLKNDRMPALICHDNENDIMYFTNLNDSETLFKLENGVVTELLPVTAKALNLWNGYLYYICDSDDPVGLYKAEGGYRIASTGDIWRYELATGKNELLVETDAFNMVVSENGIDYSCGDFDLVEIDGHRYHLNDKQYMHCDHDGGYITETVSEPIVDDTLGIYYGEYQLTADDGSISFITPDANVAVLPRNVRSLCTTVVGDKLYTLRSTRKDSENELLCIDLITGERIAYSGIGYTTDFAVVGDTIWLCHGTSFTKIKDGVKKRMILELHNFSDTGHELVCLYTDGRTLYAADDRRGIYVIEENEYGTGVSYDDSLLKLGAY